MTRRNWILLVIAIVACGAAAMFYVNRQHQPVQQAVDPVAYKAWFVDSCLKQANAVAMQQGNAFNEEQKRVLQQVCGCSADKILQKFSPADIATSQANPSDPAVLGPIKEIMQSCATETNMPATTP
jgi:hypothetical protein